MRHCSQVIVIEHLSWLGNTGSGNGLVQTRQCWPVFDFYAGPSARGRQIYCRACNFKNVWALLAGNFCTSYIDPNRLPLFRDTGTTRFYSKDIHLVMIQTTTSKRCQNCINRNRDVKIISTELEMSKLYQLFPQRYMYFQFLQLLKIWVRFVEQAIPFKRDRRILRKLAVFPVLIYAEPGHVLLKQDKYALMGIYGRKTVVEYFMLRNTLRTNMHISMSYAYCNQVITNNHMRKLIRFMKRVAIVGCPRC